MRPFRRGLARASDGGAAIEFAMTAPFLIALTLGIAQLGVVFLANAGLQQAVEVGARYATLYPRPSDARIAARILDSGYGMRASGIEGPTITHGTSDGTADGAPYIDITMSYSMPIDLIFYRSDPIRLTHKRRAYQS